MITVLLAIIIVALILVYIVPTGVDRTKVAGRSNPGVVFVPTSTIPPEPWGAALQRMQKFAREVNLSLRRSVSSEEPTYRLYRQGSLEPSLEICPGVAVINKTLRFTVYDREIMWAAKRVGRQLKNQLGASRLKINKPYLGKS